MFNVNNEVLSKFGYHIANINNKLKQNRRGFIKIECNFSITFKSS